jgi:hypothetical protein
MWILSGPQAFEELYFRIVWLIISGEKGFLVDSGKKVVHSGMRFEIIVSGV